MLRAPFLITMVIMLTLAGTANAQDLMKLFPLDEVQWADGPASLPKGSKIAILEGNPSKEGLFVFRLKFPNGYRIPAHTHPKIERVTVLKGTFNIGMGTTFDKSLTQPMQTGTYGYWPAGMNHFVWTQGETILQLHGEGPWTINYVNPMDDPRVKAQPTQ